MAHVYLAHDQILGRQVAVKVLTVEAASDPVFVERFRREAHAVAQLNHPNIVTIYDWGEQPDAYGVYSVYYMVMEYVAGENLKERLRGGPLPEADALDVAAQVAAALGVAHRHGIIHRDIKPQNVLLPPSGMVKVVDFGIAHTVGVTQLTRTNAVSGTAHYLSPEQAQSKPVDERTDLYSLGIVLYEMLTGREPFTGSTLVEIAMHHVHDAPEPPRSARPGLSAETDAIVLKALSKDPARRFQSAADMRGALLDARSDLLIRSATPGPEPTVAAPVVEERRARPRPRAEQDAVAEKRPRARSVAPASERRWPARALMAAPVLLLLLVGLPFLVLSHRGSPAAAPPKRTAALARHHATPTPTAHQARSRPVVRRANTRRSSTASPATTSGPGNSVVRPTSVPASAAQPTAAPAPAATSSPVAVGPVTRPTQPLPQAVAVAPPNVANSPPAAGGQAPAQAVGTFYDMISSGNLDGAAAMETAHMQAAYPPSSNIYQRFGRTQHISVEQSSVSYQSPDRAAVRATVWDQESPDSGRQSGRYYLTWYLVRTANGWLLDDVGT